MLSLLLICLLWLSAIFIVCYCCFYCLLFSLFLWIFTSLLLSCHFGFVGKSAKMSLPFPLRIFSGCFIIGFKCCEPSQARCFFFLIFCFIQYKVTLSCNTVDLVSIISIISPFLGFMKFFFYF